MVELCRTVYLRLELLRANFTSPRSGRQKFAEDWDITSLFRPLGGLLRLWVQQSRSLRCGLHADGALRGLKKRLLRNMSYKMQIKPEPVVSHAPSGDAARLIE